MTTYDQCGEPIDPSTGVEWEKIQAEVKYKFLCCVRLQILLTDKIIYVDHINWGHTNFSDAVCTYTKYINGWSHIVVVQETFCI